MAIGPGTRVGPYEVSALIGEGGMGKVWRAHHLELNRDDALKVLPEAFANDPDRLARFRREAQVLASLNHPNIAHVYGLEAADGVQALVMELVEGPTLADRIAIGPIPAAEALRIAKQLAEALEAAHEQRIVHRDLKPTNIKVRLDGPVKVLDFGLAKTFGADSADGRAEAAPTMAHDGTREGVVLGTAAYMSPEQARGNTVDKRADIWAFGCVLYEMLTGRLPFPGETVSDTIVAVLEHDPDWTVLPATTPPSIRRLLSRCLLKDAKQRLRDIGDARADLEEASSSQSALPGTVESAGWNKSPTARRLVPWLGAGAAGTAAVILAVLYMRPAPVATTPQNVARLTMPFTTVAPLTTFVPIALSPDGKQVAYRVDGSPGRLYIRSLDGFEARPLAGTEDGYDPFFSPDGQRVGFSTGDGKLKWVPIAGGAPQTICDLPVAGWSDGSEWQPDDTIYFSSKTIWRVAASGGTPQPVTKLDEKKGELAQRWPQILPGGKVVLFTVEVQLMGAFHIALESLKTHARSDLLQGRVYARYASNGHLIYADAPGYNTRASSGSLLSSAFDPERVTITGSEHQIVDGVWVSGNGSAQFALSPSGTLVYALRGLGRPRTLVWVDHQGKPTAIPAPAQRYNYPRLSPDEHFLSVSIVDGRRTDVCTYDLRRNVPVRVTSDGTSDFAIWKPDGKSLLFGSRRVGPVLNLYMQAADGTGDAERLVPSDNGQIPSSLPSSGDVLVFNERSSRSSAWHTSVLALNMPRTSHPVITGPSEYYVGGRISPDGHWIAYVSDEEGKFEIYVRSFPSFQKKSKISAEGGIEVVWAPNGRELYWRNGNKMMVAAFQGMNGVPAGTPRVLFDRSGYSPGMPAIAQYDVARDGRFVMVQEGSPPPPPTQLNVVLNWIDELKSRVGAAKR